MITKINEFRKIIVEYNNSIMKDHYNKLINDGHEEQEALLNTAAWFETTTDYVHQALQDASGTHTVTESNNQPIGYTSSKKNKPIYRNFDHPAHSDFNMDEHEVAADLHNSLKYDRQFELFPKTNGGLRGRTVYLSQAQKDKLNNDSIYSFHHKQASLHSAKSSDLYTTSPQKTKDDQRIANRKQFEIDQRKERQAKLKTMSIEDKEKIGRLKMYLNRLSQYHPGDDNPFGSGSVKDARAVIRNSIQNIEKNYLT